MPIVRFLVYLLLLPGDIIRRKIGMSVEEDGGILRSFINSSVWGAILAGIALHYFT